MSQVSSEGSEGGWVDLFDDNATKRLQRRVRREQRKPPSHQQSERDSEGAIALRELLGEVDLEEVEAPPEVRIKRSRSKIDFAKALQRCGEAAPERWDDEWKQALMKRHEDSQKNLAIRGVRAVTKTASAAAAEVLDNLDGVAKMARVDLSKASVKRTVAEAGRLAGRVKEEGVVQVIQSSGMVRKWRYGLEDDE
ncbi:unnamed protein product, partial [Polarella glacialis]